GTRRMDRNGPGSNAHKGRRCYLRESAGSWVNPVGVNETFRKAIHIGHIEMFALWVSCGKERMRPARHWKSRKLSERSIGLDGEAIYIGTCLIADVGKEGLSGASDLNARYIRVGHGTTAATDGTRLGWVRRLRRNRDVVTSAASDGRREGEACGARVELQ